MTMTAVEALTKVEKHEPLVEVRDATALTIGEGFRQGDVYLVRVSYATALGTRAGGGGVDGSLHRQLVPGNTQGARHIITGDAELYTLERVYLPAWIGETALVGPAIRVGPLGAKLTHPEHAHFILPPDSLWASWQQMDMRTLRRVQD